MLEHRGIRAQFNEWVRRNGLLTSRQGGFGVIGTASLKKGTPRGGKLGWRVEVCRPSNHGYPGGFGYDYPFLGGQGDLFAFMAKPYVLEPSLSPQGMFEVCPCVVGHDVCKILG